MSDDMSSVPMEGKRPLRLFMAASALVVLILVGLVALGLFSYKLIEAQSPPPPVPHPTQGRESCTSCHSPSVLPASHAGRTDQTCLLCHKASAPSTPTVTPTPSTPPSTEQVAEPSSTPTPISQASVTPTSTPVPSPVEACLVCHGTPGLTMTFQIGEKVSLAVSAEEFKKSAHGNLLVCQDCHRGYEQLPHPSPNVVSYRAYVLTSYEVCRACHFDKYTKTLDSVHFQELSSGNWNAPVCTDCHGAHYVSSPSQPPSRVAQTCSQCHEQVFQLYLGSVHGKALMDEENQDVPTCVYCHGVHNIKDPRTASHRLEIPQLCGSCHADVRRMDKYGLSTDVVKTYLQDFHGVTVTLASKQNPDILSYEAVCTDCHGTHNVVSTKSPGSPVIRANMVQTCSKCHAGATENFPDAWLSHYEPSLKHAPLVFMVKAFYYVLIPIIVIGLAIQVVLNLWRSAINH